MEIMGWAGFGLNKKGEFWIREEIKRKIQCISEF